MSEQTPKSIFEQHIPGRLSSKPDLAGKLACIYKFTITGEEGGNWIVDCKTNTGKVYAGDDQADCTITMTSADFVAMVAGKLNPQMAFMTGKVKVAGNMGLALKLGDLLK